MDSLRDQVLEDSAIMAGEHWALHWPSPSRDLAIIGLMSDEETVLPNLPHLHNNSQEQLERRRERAREEFEEGFSLFLDIVWKEAAEGEAEDDTGTIVGAGDDTGTIVGAGDDTGTIVGAGGFRVVDREGGKVEWGVVVKKEWRNRGICREVFDACKEYAKQNLAVDVMEASTIIDNDVMRQFLEKRGFQLVGERTEGEYAWADYELSL